MGLCAFLRWHYPDQVRRVSLTRNTAFSGPLANAQSSMNGVPAAWPVDAPVTPTQLAAWVGQL